LKKNAFDANHPIVSTIVCDMLKIKHGQSLPLLNAAGTDKDKDVTSLYPTNVKFYEEPNVRNLESMQMTTSLYPKNVQFCE
jgi:hypothetical protein